MFGSLQHHILFYFLHFMPTLLEPTLINVIALDKNSAHFSSPSTCTLADILRTPTGGELKMCIRWQAERRPPPCALSGWQTARYIMVLSFLLAPAPLPGQIERVILCSHLISPSCPLTETFPLLQWGEKGGDRERHAENTFPHTHKHNADSETYKGSHMPFQVSVDTHFHAHTCWPLYLPPQGCHWSSNTAEHQSAGACLLVSFFFFFLAFRPHPLILFPLVLEFSHRRLLFLTEPAEHRSYLVYLSAPPDISALWNIPKR